MQASSIDSKSAVTKTMTISDIFAHLEDWLPTKKWENLDDRFILDKFRSMEKLHKLLKHFVCYEIKYNSHTDSKWVDDWVQKNQVGIVAIMISSFSEPNNWHDKPLPKAKEIAQEIFDTIFKKFFNSIKVAILKLPVSKTKPPILTLGLLAEASKTPSSPDSDDKSPNAMFISRMLHN